MSRFVPKVAVAVTLPLGIGFRLNSSTSLYDVDGAAAAAATGNPPAAGTLLSGDAATAYTFPELAATMAPILAPLLAPLLGSSSSSGTTPTPTPTPTPAATSFASPLTFAGAAGAPTGNQVLTGSAVSSFTLDGSGGLICGTAANQSGILVAAGYTPAIATITVTPKTPNPMLLGRVDASGQNGGWTIWEGSNFLRRIVLTNGVPATLTWQYGPGFDAGNFSYAWSTFGIRMDSSGGWHPQINGADVNVPGGMGAWTPPLVSQGYIIIGSGFTAAGAVLSQIAVA